MEWWGGRVSLGNLDLAGAVNKLQESVKNIEKNFDTALGFEERLDSGSQGQSSGSPTQSSNNSEILSHRGEEKESELKDAESLQDDARSPESKDNLPEQAADPQDPYLFQEKRDNETGVAVNLTIEPTLPSEEVELKAQKDPVDFGTFNILSVNEGSGKDSSNVQNSTAPLEPVIQDVATTMESTKQLNEEDKSDMQSSQESESMNKSNHRNVTTCKSSDIVDAQENLKMLPAERVSLGSQAGIKIQYSEPSGATGNGEPRSPIESTNHRLSIELPNDEVQIVSDVTSEENHAKPGTIEVSKFSNVAEVDSRENVVEVVSKEHRLSSASNVSDAVDAVHELEKVKREMKMMETALQGAGRQAQAKADEIAKLINENEQLKFVVEDLKRKSNDAEMESLREECHQRVATLERKVYALTKERDALRREQSKRSDAAALLKEKDEIINQVMAEGEELSKKQAAQEAQIRKLRAQTRELEEEKKSLITKLQLEENKVESIRKDKAATEKLLQETIEKHQAELADQKEYYTSALIAAKEAEELAEARASNEARTELEGHLREAEEREAMLVQALEELRQALSRQEQQAISKEDMLRRDIEDLQKRYQASECRCEELVSQLPESTRPLLRQIEAMQEASAQKAEAWAAVERTLQSRLQEAEAKAAAAEERERSINERLSQTLSRVNVLEAQIPCLRAEQTQLNRSLEKERQRAAESRQEYLAAKEEADTHEGRAYQLEVEIRELKRKHKNDLQESLAYRELLQQELEREKAIRLDLEKAARLPSSSAVDQNLAEKSKSELENGKLMRQLSTPSSVGNMEKSFCLEASLDSSRSFLEKRGAAATNPYCLKSMAPSAFEAALRQKEGELASYMSRLASMESIRDSLAEELVKMTEQCDKLRTEAAMLPGIRAELQALRRRHTAALELMGERDEELEELRADIVDLKEMYREQVNLLVNKIQILSSQVGIA